MNRLKKTHLSYWIAGLAIVSMGAAYSARAMIEIGPTATVTGSFPEIRLLDTDAGDTDWEIEANGDHLQIGLNAGGQESVRIYSDAIEDNLVVSGEGVSIGGTPVADLGGLPVLTLGGTSAINFRYESAASDWFLLQSCLLYTSPSPRDS